jgi:hypothetical protein
VSPEIERLHAEYARAQAEVEQLTAIRVRAEGEARSAREVENEARGHRSDIRIQLEMALGFPAEANDD